MQGGGGTRTVQELEKARELDAALNSCEPLTVRNASIALIESTFRKLDKNGDGEVCTKLVEEIRNGDAEVCALLGKEEQASLVRRFDELDSDGSGKLNLEEFTALFRNSATELDEAKAEIARLRALLSSNSSAQSKTTGVTDQAKRIKLKTMKVFILDNTLREPSVAATFGHTVQDKHECLKWVKKVGFKNIIVGAKNRNHQVDDTFCQELQADKADTSNYWTFSEYSDVRPPIMDEEHIPIGLLKTKKYGLQNCVIELDAADPGFDWEESGTKGWVAGLKWLLEWMLRNLGQQSRSMVNIRDLPVALLKAPGRVEQLVAAIAQLPSKIRPIGLLFEEPLGEYFPSEVAAWTAMLRRTMDENGWTSTFQDPSTDDPSEDDADGLLLLHVHEMWGFKDAANLEGLAAGADGMFAAMCEEGAAMGHASTAVALTNLARLGNTFVTRRFNLRDIAEAARVTTRLSSGKSVHAKQIVYGPCAVEAVFGFTGIGGGVLDKQFDRDGDGDVDAIDHFQLAELLGVQEPPIRLHIMSTPQQFVDRLRQCFGAEAGQAGTEDSDADADLALGERMLKQVHANLNSGVEAEYTSTVGIAKLYQQVTGAIRPEMEQAIAQQAERLEGWEKGLLTAAKSDWQAVVKESGSADGKLSFSEFTAVYLQSYFQQHNHLGTYFTNPGEQARVMGVISRTFDYTKDGRISWEQWQTWLLWALRSFPHEIEIVDDLPAVVVRHSVLPQLLAKEGVEAPAPGQ